MSDIISNFGFNYLKFRYEPVYFNSIYRFDCTRIFLKISKIDKRYFL